MADLSQLSNEELQGLYAQQRQPRGIRNNNPLNLKATVDWTGATGRDGPFATFASMDDGLAAADRNLQTYGTKHGIKTVAGVVNRWAPPNADGNHTEAYTRHVAGKLGVDPNAEIDMANPATRQALIGSMAEFENGEPLPAQAPAASDLSSMSDDELKALYEPPPTAARPTPRALPRPTAPITRRDQGLGFRKGAMKPLDNAAGGLEWAAGVVGLDKPINRLGEMLGLPTTQGSMDERQAEIDQKRAEGVAPGRLGEFAGNMAGTLPLAMLPGGAATQGALSGAALTDAKDAKGIAGDAVISALGGKVADKGLKLVGKGAQALLGKAPKVMGLPELEAAKKAAYDLVDNSGFAFPAADVSKLVDDFAKTVSGSALSKSAKDDAKSIIQYARTLAKGDLPLSQLEKLRGDIYEAMVAKGGDTSKVGGQFRAKIDDLIDSTGNTLVRDARDLNTRWSKARTVDRASKSADIRAEKDYGGDYGRKLKDRLFPLIDPANPKRSLRGATADETAAIKKLVTGTKMQNAASTAGGMLDPRRMGGKILTGITATGGGAGAPMSGGLSLLVPAAQMGAGVALTGAASSTARRNMDELLKLIAVGGSKSALKKSATPASRAAQTATARARQAAGLIGAAAAAQGLNGL